MTDIITTEFTSDPIVKTSDGPGVSLGGAFFVTLSGGNEPRITSLANGAPSFVEFFALPGGLNGTLSIEAKLLVTQNGDGTLAYECVVKMKAVTNCVVQFTGTHYWGVQCALRFDFEDNHKVQVDSMVTRNDTNVFGSMAAGEFITQTIRGTI